MKQREDFYVYIVVAIFSLVVIVMSLFLDTMTAKLLPLIFGSLMLALALLGIVNSIRFKEAKTAGAETEKAKDGEAKYGWRHYVPIATWILGFFLLTFLFGFLVAIPVFFFSYLKTHKIKWPNAMMATILVTAIVYLVFIAAFDIDLYEGILILMLRRNI